MSYPARTVEKEIWKSFRAKAVLLGTTAKTLASLALIMLMEIIEKEKVPECLESYLDSDTYTLLKNFIERGGGNGVA